MANQGNQQLQPLNANDGDYNMHVELIHSIMSGMAVSTLVTVKKVNATNKQIDVQPIVTQVDGFGHPISHGIIYGIPYMQVQYGSSAILMTPKVGDIGLCVFCHNDISGVKKTKKESLPGSYRRNSFSDGIYMGGLFNPPPSSFIEFTSDGKINMTATSTVQISTSDSVNITSSSLTHNGVNIGATHVHGGVQTGSGNSAIPH